MLKKIALAILAIVVLFVLVVSLQPAAFRVERQATIAAPPATIFVMINDFKVWDAWSPWAKIDPAMKKTLSGAAQGRGAVYEWAGNSDVGSGRMEIIDIREGERVTIKLDFLTPFEASNVSEFTLASGSAGTTATTVTWAMTGHNGFMGKAIGLFMNMDQMVGADFEKGLAQLKSLAEAAPKG